MESTTVMTASNSADFRSFTIKSMLIVSHLAFGINKRCNSLRGILLG